MAKSETLYLFVIVHNIYIQGNRYKHVVDSENNGQWQVFHYQNFEV